jgi:pyrophosphatase PpaX
MKFDAIVFDLDGTLIDSSKGILDSLFKAMDVYGIEPAITKLDSHFFMGKSLPETLDVLMPGATKEMTKKVGDYYVSHYYDNYMDKAETFEGVKETIRSLHERGYKMAVATAKHTFCAEAELKSAGIRGYFLEVRGRDEGVPAKPDPKLLFEICEKLKVDPKKILMVGDTDRDVLFGKNAGTSTCAVTYGNWSKEKFINENIIPDMFIDRFDGILNLIEN